MLFLPALLSSLILAGPNLVSLGDRQATRAGYSILYVYSMRISSRLCIY